MVRRIFGLLAAAFVAVVAAGPARAETRVALVLGTGTYQTSPMPTALNSAGVVAQTLRELGFATVEGADLPQAELRGAVANFMAKAREAGPDSIIFVYLSGLGLQHESDSYLIPSDTVVARESDVPIGGIRLQDITRALAGVPSKAKVVLFDLSQAHPYTSVGEPVRPGLGVLDGAPSMLIASAAAPGQVSSPDEAAYSRFALALTEQLRDPGIPVDQIVARARLRVHQQTNGRDTPWEIGALAQPAPVLTLAPDQAATGSTPPPPVPLAQRPMEGLSAQEAYALAIEQDTIVGYQNFLRIYPNDPLSPRIKRLLAAKREAQVWRQTVRYGSPQACWTYLRRYPNGPHADEARWRLTRLSAPIAPPPVFEEVVYEDLPPPLPVVEVIDDPVFWAPAPPAFYDTVVLAPVYLGPPVAPIWALAPPPPYVWGALPVVAAAAIVAAPFVLPRVVRPPVAPVVLRPPPGGPRWGGGPGGRQPAALAPVGPVGNRPLPGAPGGSVLPGGAASPVLRPGAAGAVNPALRAAPAGAVSPALRAAPAGAANPALRPGGQALRPAAGPMRASVNPGPRMQRGAPQSGFQPRMNAQRRMVSPITPRMSAPRMSAPRMSAPRMSAPRMSAPRMAAPAAPRMSAPRMSAPRMSAPRMSAPRAQSSNNNRRRH